MKPLSGSCGSVTWYTARGAAAKRGASAGRTGAWLSVRIRLWPPSAATSAARVWFTVGVTVRVGATVSAGTVGGGAPLAQPAADTADATPHGARVASPGGPIPAGKRRPGRPPL